MRYVAPARLAVDPAVFSRPPLSEWPAQVDWLRSPAWPTLDAINAARPTTMRERFAEQTLALLDDGLHYELRIAQQATIATRAANWHDLFNAMAWLRYPDIKRALNAQQVAEIAHMGTRERSRAQYALTHFDEAGVMVVLRDRHLLDLWDAHDWHGLFWRERDAWLDGRARVEVFGHALLEHALTPAKLLVGKAIAFLANGETLSPENACANGIREGRLLRDPLELRPLPLSGLPGWHPESGLETFHRHTACYQPRRAGRTYPPAVTL
ncbi:MAG TPA: DUF3025 domain-containing protein [Dyella sp.]|uniref:DUF3025 domain-containing protein n=1 Tax=Dyella sp. TaxID=1869338 RepID=UPI002D7798FD|nr:DUF3025 domain-containing protein [Dyella sp.]HET6552741.1 DUF3025 domain-containing protein [Dyella sp.]